jgi:hypothetical protein
MNFNIVAIDANGRRAGNCSAFASASLLTGTPSMSARNDSDTSTFSSVPQQVVNWGSREHNELQFSFRGYLFKHWAGACFVSRPMPMPMLQFFVALL